MTALTLCPCGHAFFDEWEQVQHMVHGRHHYRSVTPSVRRALAESFTDRREMKSHPLDPNSVEGRYAESRGWGSTLDPDHAEPLAERVADEWGELA